MSTYPGFRKRGNGEMPKEFKEYISIVKGNFCFSDEEEENRL